MGFDVLGWVFFIFTVIFILCYEGRRIYNLKYRGSILPHEVFPELIHWEEGDQVNEKNCSTETFLGISNNMIHTRLNKDGELLSYTVKKAKKNLINPQGRKRYFKFKEQQLKRDISEDSYNDFLVSLKEANVRLLQGEQ